MLPDSKKTKLGGSDQETSLSADKNTGVVLVPCLYMEVHPYSYFQWCKYFWRSRVSFITTDEFSVSVSATQPLQTVAQTKNTNRFQFSHSKLF